MEEFVIQRPPLNDKSLNGLHEFMPVGNTIGQSEFQYFQFNINTTSGLGKGYELLIFISGSLCSEPDDLKANNYDSLTVYYSFNSSMFQNREIGEMLSFQNGYVQALADLAVSMSDIQTLYIAVGAPQSTNTSATWSYQIGVSQNDLVFQYDNDSFATVLDTDHESVLIQTGELHQPEGYSNISSSNFQLFVFDESQGARLASLNSSWCAIRNGPALYQLAADNLSYSNRDGSLRELFYLDGLEPGTRYLAYLLYDFQGGDSGGTVYSQFEFETMSANSCALIYDLDFCLAVAYSVPASSLARYSSKEDLKYLYDDRALELFQNFSKALQQIACDASADSVYSPLVGCGRCNASYVDWLCAVSIPRCSTESKEGFVYREANESRNDWITENVQPYAPYYEVLPCVNVCYAIVRDCPADFGFSCPTKRSFIEASYYWDLGYDYQTCNYVDSGYPQVNFASVVTASWSMVMLGLIFSMMW